MKWSESTTLQFVKIYLKQLCLWNPTHGAYKLRYKREQAYAAIIAEFKELTGKILSVPEVKNKIKSLRTTYSQEVHKILHKSRPDCLYEPALIWFHEMDQCLKNISYKRQPSYYYDYEKTDLAEVDASTHAIWAEDVTQSIHNGSFEGLNPDPLVATLTNAELDTKLSDNSLSIETVVKIEPLEQCFEIDNKSKRLEEDDEFETYGKFIATQLRQMDLDRAIKIQLAIQHLLSEA